MFRELCTFLKEINSLSFDARLYQPYETEVDSFYDNYLLELSIYKFRPYDESAYRLLNAIPMPGVNPENFYRNLNGDGYLYKTDANENKTLILDQKVYSINVINNYIYFISEDMNNKICRTDMEGKNLTVLCDDIAYFMMVSEDSIYYTDDKGHLYRLSHDGEDKKLLSDKHCAWPILYRDYIIFCSANEKYKLLAVNINSGDIVEISEYGFTPTVYEDTIYTQNKDNGYINVLDLQTGDIINSINYCGQQFYPTNKGCFFTNLSDIFFLSNETKEISLISIEDTDDENSSKNKRIISLLHCDDESIYFSVKIKDDTYLKYLYLLTNEILDL